MAKPINLYQGQAPAAMAQMGAGISEAGANIGRTLQRGYESMGQGIASGINAVAGAYQQYKDDEAKFGAAKKMFKAFGSSLDEGARKEIDTIFADTSMSVREKNALTPALMQYLGASQQQKQALEKQQRELDAAMAGRVFSEGATKDRTLLGIQARAEELGGPALPTDSGAATPNALMPGAPFYDQGLGQPQTQSTPFGSSLKKRHFGGF